MIGNKNIFTNRALWLLAAVTICLLSGGSGKTDEAAAITVEAQISMQSLDNALNDWDYFRAAASADKLNELAEDQGLDNATKSKVLSRVGKYYFYTGDYKKSLETFDRYKESNQQDLSQDYSDLYDRVKHLTGVWKKYETRDSEHFQVHWVPGKDKVMVGPTLDTLEKAYSILINELGVDPGPPKILVEFYPDFPAFSKATGLSEEDVKNSGTVAVCKYRRLMMTTPRALSFGYDYLTTLSHEFVHLLVYTRQGDRCPIWLQEGMAKYFESRWKGEPGGLLTPTAESVLASALRTDQLITFDRMSPSFAKLDTPQQGQLAFAEVCVTVRYIHHLAGKELLFKILDALKTGMDYRHAVQIAVGKPFDEFFKDCKTWAKTQNYKELEGVEPVEIKLKDRESDEDSESVNEDDIKENAGWRFVRLGDMLRDASRVQASILEYDKGLAELPNSARVLNKLGLAHILAGEYQDALPPLETCQTLYPTYVTSYINKGRAYEGMKDELRAIENFEQATNLNPFDPEPYIHLVNLYNNTKQEGMAKEALARLQIIQGRDTAQETDIEQESDQSIEPEQ